VYANQFGSKIVPTENAMPISEESTPAKARRPRVRATNRPITG
jgi:hypothetical protein